MTEEAIGDYLSGDRLICLLCGRTYVAMGRHLSITHKVPLDAYKGRYGLPWRRGLVGQEYHTYLQETARKLQKQGKILSGPPEGFLEILKRRKPAKPPQPYHIKNSALGHTYDPEIYEEALRRIKSGRTPRDVSFDDDMPCSATINRYCEENSEYNQRYIQAIEELPFYLQAQACILGQRFKVEVLMLHRQNFTQEEIAQKLGVSTGPIQKVFSQLRKEGRFVQKKIIIWIDQDFDEILNRIARGQQPKVVCAAADVPGFSTWQRYLSAHPDYQKRYEDLIDSMPYSFQIKCGGLRHRFCEEARKLHQDGQTTAEIAQQLGVSIQTVITHVNKSQGAQKEEGD